MKKNRIHTRILAGVMTLVMSLTFVAPALAAEEMDVPPPEAVQEEGIPGQTTLEQEFYTDPSMIYLSAGGSDDASGSEASPKATLAAAYAAVPDNGTIAILGAISLEEPVTFDGGKRLILAGQAESTCPISPSRPCW